MTLAFIFPNIHTDELTQQIFTFVKSLFSWTCNPDSVSALPDLYKATIYPSAPCSPLITLSVHFPKYKSPSSVQTLGVLDCRRVDL